jgi:hypothetical protein
MGHKDVVVEVSDVELWKASITLTILLGRNGKWKDSLISHTSSREAASTG